MNELDSLITQEFIAEEVSIINILDLLLNFAYELGASDIHLDPSSTNLRVRFRIDGVLNDINPLPQKISEEIVSRIKILSNLRTDEHNSAQDGRFRFQTKNKSENLDVRVSIMPTYYGENAVLRLLVDKSQGLTLDNLGFTNEDKKKILSALKKTAGMILVTGPTGSGKTTTLYALIKILNTKERSIITLEDPIEYAVENIEQIQVNPRFGISFANGLRSILRQDPDMIMIGEIRDTDTASISVNTALTGHLLLSTLHTNDAVTALHRLLDMGIEPFLVASTVNIVISQRLVRKICQKCKETKPATQEIYESITEIVPSIKLDKNHNFYYGAGCEDCNFSGYSGRTVICEVLEINEEIRKLILKKESSGVLKKNAQSSGMISMIEDGINKAKQGITTLEEILRLLSD